jgi:hypothetical protein
MDTKTTLSVVIAIVIILAGVVLLTNKKTEPVIAPVEQTVAEMPLNEINLAPASSTVPTNVPAGTTIVTE